jgi:hypothetical protein
MPPMNMMPPCPRLVDSKRLCYQLELQSLCVGSTEGITRRQTAESEAQKRDRGRSGLSFAVHCRQVWIVQAAVYLLYICIIYSS